MIISRYLLLKLEFQKPPDELFLSLDNYQNSKLWFVEYQLRYHDVKRHIFLQIMGFLNALKTNHKKNSKEIIINIIKSNPPTNFNNKKQNPPSDEEIYHFLKIVFYLTPGIVIVIDKKLLN